MNRHSRRRVLAILGLGVPMTALAGCGLVTSATTGGTTTVTLNVTEIDQYGGAIITALQNALAAPALVGLLGAVSVARAQAALVSASNSLAAFEKLANGAVSLSVNVTSAQGLITSLVSDAQTVLNLVQGIFPKLTPASVASDIQNYVSAVLSLIPFIELAAQIASSALVVTPAMTASDAVAAANAKPLSYTIPLR